MLFCLSHGYHQILHLADRISLFAAHFLRPLYLNLLPLLPVFKLCNFKLLQVQELQRLQPQAQLLYLLRSLLGYPLGDPLLLCRCKPSLTSAGPYTGLNLFSCYEHSSDVCRGNLQRLYNLLQGTTFCFSLR